MTPVERQVERLLRAWPRPDRVERGEEILATTLDLVAPGRRRLPLALAASLVVGGLAARWRTRPPIWHWFRYARDGELPPRWHRWMLSDLLSPGWCRRMVARTLTTMTAMTFIGMTVVMTVLQPLPSPVGSRHWYPPSIWAAVSMWSLSLIGYSILGAASGAALTRSKWAGRQRARILADNGYDEFGQPDPLARPRQELKAASRRRRGANSVPALKAAAELGAGMRKAGRLDEAVSVLSETFERAKTVAPDDDWPTWIAGCELAVAFAQHGRLDGAVQVAREVLAAYQRLLGPDSVESLATASHLGRFLREAGRVDEAIDLLADTFERAKRQALDDNWSTWATGHELALALEKASRVDEAVDVGTEVLAAKRRLYGTDDQATLATASNLGMHLKEAGRLDEAVSLLADTFERCKRQAADNAPTWRTGHALVLALEEADRVDVAVDVGTDVLAAKRRLQGPDDVATLRTACCLVTCLRKTGRVDEAIDLFADTLERAGEAACIKQLLRSTTHLAETSSQSNRHDEAQDLGIELLSELHGIESVRPDRGAFLRTLLPGSDTSET